MIEALGVIGISTIGLGAIIGLAYRGVAPVMPFLYANARIQARANYLLTQQKVEALADSKSVNDMINAMQESEYAPFIEAGKTLRENHAGIEKGFLYSIKDMRQSSPESMQKILDAYLMFWEAKIIKSFYRQRFTSKENEAVAIDDALVFPVGLLDEKKIKHLRETKSLADIKVVLGGTVYSRAFEEKFDSLEEFEVALDNVVFTEFVKTIKAAKIHDSEIIMEVFSTKFDILNLLVLLKCEARNVDEGKRKRLLIKNSTEIYRRADKLVYAKGIADLVELCKGTKYHEVLNAALEEYNKDKSLSHFEKGLLRFYRKKVEGEELGHFQGAFPIIAYFVKKELEQRNLLILSKGIDAGFKAQEIRELLV